MSPINAPHRPAISATYGVCDAFRLQGFEFTDGLPPSHRLFLMEGFESLNGGERKSQTEGLGEFCSTISLQSKALGGSMGWASGG